jgi:hypothetical protein
MATSSTVELPSISHLAYRPVDSSNGEISLVKLAPGEKDEPFRFTVHTKRLDEKNRVRSSLVCMGRNRMSA